MQQVTNPDIFSTLPPILCNLLHSGAVRPLYNACRVFSKHSFHQAFTLAIVSKLLPKRSVASSFTDLTPSGIIVLKICFVFFGSTKGLLAGSSFPLYRLTASGSKPSVAISSPFTDPSACHITFQL